MDKINTQDIGPDFSKFKNIPPGFAGTIIDWSMGSREITATIIDLILRDYLSVMDNKVIKNKKSKPLKNFEKRFIITIFGQSDSLTFAQFSQIAYKKEFDALLKILADGMMEEGFVDKNFQEKMVNAVKESIDEMHLNSARDRPKPLIQTKSSAPHVIIIPVWGWIIIGVLFVIISFLSPSLFSIWPYIIVIIIIGVILNIKIKKKLGKTYDWMLSDVGKKAKTDCIALKNYMETYPLLEDRLANELVSHAIAFGLGKRWMNRLGKFDADIKLFVESLNTQDYTMYRFMDWDSYIKAFSQDRI